MSVRVGKVIGIPVSLDYSLVIAFALVTWTLAAGRMPAEYPGYRSLVYWIIGLTSAGILFISVFLHELAHSYHAKRNGISISKIVLFIFGDVAQMEEEAANPRGGIQGFFDRPTTSLSFRR